VHVNNPNDIPAKMWLEFDNQESCERALGSLTFWVKFKDFKVTGQCSKKS
jgi:hypothetical protein